MYLISFFFLIYVDVVGKGEQKTGRTVDCKKKKSIHMLINYYNLHLLFLLSYLDNWSWMVLFCQMEKKKTKKVGL